MLAPVLAIWVGWLCLSWCCCWCLKLIILAVRLVCIYELKYFPLVREYLAPSWFWVRVTHLHHKPTCQPWKMGHLALVESYNPNVQVPKQSLDLWVGNPCHWWHVDSRWGVHGGDQGPDLVRWESKRYPGNSPGVQHLPTSLGNFMGLSGVCRAFSRWCLESNFCLVYRELFLTGVWRAISVKCLYSYFRRVSGELFLSGVWRAFYVWCLESWFCVMSRELFLSDV